MASNSSVWLIPIVLAFLVFIAQFYGRENAVSKTSPSFLLSLLMVAMLLSYLGLVVGNALFPYAAVSFGIAGLAFLVLSVVMFLL